MTKIIPMVPILRMVPYKTGTGLTIYLPPGHPLVKDTEEARIIRKEWETHRGS